jgi:ribosomal protein S18 acetylase RimI-like enzyme
VKPEARGNGIGAALMDALIARVKKEKLFLYVRAVVTVSPLNASRVFQKKGFTQYGKESRGIKSGEALFDQEYWKLDI